MKAVLLLLAACALPDGEDYEGAAYPAAAQGEAYCALYPELDCGHVVMCEAAADNDLGHVELCINDDHPVALAEEMYGACVPTPRHQGLCAWCCGEGCGRGCNAFSGCFCPEEP